MRLIIVLLSILTLGAGCKKWLDVKPKTMVDADKLFTTEKGFEDVMYGAYTIMANTPLYGEQMTMRILDVLAQQYNVQSNSGHTFYQSSIYNYSDAGVAARKDSIWVYMYGVIGNVNNVLQHIDGQQGLFQGNNYSLMKGEALGLRAF